ncbi:MAG TPA: tripartite tricarboxylate transporter substrate-binding protein [Burkholderiaceae bacterium]|nr:tripartite tricarboxylate transporter substrate-binding protein [Burkholderiaceae bacterium]
MKLISSSARVLAALAASLSLVAPSLAQTYPSKPLHIVVPHPAGIGVDVEARLLAALMSTELGQPVLVENRPGFGTLIAMEGVAKTAPDGYTIGIGLPSNLASHPRLFDRPTFDVERGLTPVSLMWSLPWGLYVNSAVPATSLAELVALAKVSPVGLTYATTGVGSFQHLTTEWLMSLTGAKLRHVPYGTSPWTPDVLSGRVDVVLWTLSGMTDHVKAGKLRLLAVSNGNRRSEQVPDVPTFAEAGLPSFDVTAWAGLVVPAGTPLPIVEKLAAAAAKAVNSASFREHVAKGGGTIVASSPAEFEAHLRVERARWKKVITDAGIRLE